MLTNVLLDCGYVLVNHRWIPGWRERRQCEEKENSAEENDSYEKTQSIELLLSGRYFICTECYLVSKKRSSELLIKAP